MKLRKKSIRRTFASFLATVLIVGTSLPVSAVEEIAEGANESENKDLIDVEPNVFNDSSEEVLISSELEENKDQIGLYLRDYEMEEPLGIIEEFDDVDGDLHEYQWDLTVEGLDRKETKDIEDGQYYIEIIVQDDTQEPLYQREEILVHSDNAKIQLDEVNEDGIYLTEDNIIQGQIDSSLSEYEIIEEAPDVEYRLEQQEEIYQEDAVTLDEDGGFQINDALEEGTSTLTIEVTDVAGNETVEQIEIELLEEEVREERSEDKVKEEDQAEESEDNNQENKEETDEVDEPRTMQSIEVSYQDGDNGEHVYELKQDLTALGFGNFPSDPSMAYGSVTEGVVEDFQAHYDLGVTGVADEVTLAKIEKILSSPYQDGYSGDYVVELKEDLTALGYGSFPSDPSTVYGSVTEGVVKDFQEAQGLPVSGIADEITLAIISDLLDPPYQDGDTGEHIVNLKQDLTALGFGNFPSNPSTVYGSVTEGVVEDFQSYYDLDVTGNVDEATLEQMEDVLASSYQDGHSGDYVVELKEDLTMLGYGSFPSDPSTVYGSVTEGVVKDFQEAQGLPVSGIADEETLATINDLLSPPHQDGDQGEHIVDLKQDLTALGFGNFPSDPSIYYGSVTEGVVEDFQSYYDLDVTGNVDEATLEQMEDVLASSYQDGHSGDYVVELKEDLTMLGYGSFPSDPSTVYGSVTEGVVKDFQEAQGLPVSGIADEETLATINDLFDPPHQDGDQGEHIVDLKQDLTALGFGNFPSDPSIYYGSVTEGVVEDFQSYYDLDVTGDADEATLDQMEEVFASSYQDGHSGDYVVELKEDLTALGFGNFPSDPSTVYGSVTEGVVKDFQAYYGLVTNGMVDEITLSKLEEILGSPYQDGESGDYVVGLKEDLTKLGFGNFPSSPSTAYGPVTEGVVKDFQSAYGLPVSGIADEVTLATLSETLENMNEIKIFIDPGHGAHDSGGTGNGLQEKNVALDISLHAAEVLEDEYLGVDVMMSRTTDEFIELEDRAAMANDWGADYFVSVHNNAFNGLASGFESYIYNGNVSSTTIEKQEEVHQYIANELDATDRGAQTANFSVLRNTSMSAILLELLFIDNAVDAETLGSAEGRAELGHITADAIAHAWDLERR
ncbi:peptidoglycan-binding protein [Salicibibacter kimchii]|nr:peptidoglycan-binding protein [Salicibibacter kimchii]